MADHKKIEIHGHRGFRGRFPENTIVSFIEAVKTGADAIEMDVVISKDLKVVVSHEAWMNEAFCSFPNGGPVTANEREKFNFFKMNYGEIRQFDCGSRVNPEFPLQQTAASHKPLLSEVIDEVEGFTKKNDLASVKYNIELKTEENSDGIFQPPPKQFVELVLNVLNTLNAPVKFMLQSFDVRILQEIKKQRPDTTISLLVENKLSLEKNLNALGFLPEIYGPEFILIDEEMISELKSKNVKLIPWTANEKSDMERLITMGVDGLITDFPDTAMELFR